MKQFLLLLTTTLLLFSCSSNDVTGIDGNPDGGTSIEVSTLLKGVAVTADHKPIENLSISIYPIKTMSDSTVRDSLGTPLLAQNGKFSSEVAYRGPVGIEIKDHNGNGAFRAFSVSTADTTIDLDTIVLEQLATIRIILDTSELTNEEINTIFPIWCKELGDFSATDFDLTKTYDSIPQGTYTFSVLAGYYNKKSSDFILDTDTTVTVKPNDTLEVIITLKNLDANTMSPELQTDIATIQEIMTLNGITEDMARLHTSSDSSLTEITKRNRIGIKNGRISYVSINYNLDTLPPSIGNLTELEWLIINTYDGGNSFTSIPASISQLQRLHTLELEGHFELIPQSLWQLKNLRLLTIKSSSLLSLPESIATLEGLVELRLSCKQLQELPDCIGDLTNLSYLGIFDCPNVKYLPESIKNIETLNELEFEGKHFFTELPQIFYELPQVQKFSFQFFWIPSDREEEWAFEKMFNNDMELYGNWLDRLFERYYLSYKGKKELDIIHKIHTLNGMEFNLELYHHYNYVDIERGRVKGLQIPTDTIIPELCQLDELERLTIINRTDMKQITTPRKYLKFISYGVVNLFSLRSLTLYCDSLKVLPGNIGYMDNLEFLTITCDSLITLPPRIGLSKSLKSLYISCRSLGTLPSEIKDIDKLESITIYTKENKAKELPEALYGLRPDIRVSYNFTWVPNERQQEWALIHMFQGDKDFFNKWLEQLEKQFGSTATE